MSNYTIDQDGVITSHQDSAANHFMGFIGSETYPRIKLNTNGLEMGPGSSDMDVKWYRDNSNTMRSDNFVVAGGLAVLADSQRIVNSKTPATASSIGDVGQICWDTNYVYVCVATNTWKRSALATW